MSRLLEGDWILFVNSAKPSSSENAILCLIAQKVIASVHRTCIHINKMKVTAKIFAMVFLPDDAGPSIAIEIFSMFLPLFNNKL